MRTLRSRFLLIVFAGIALPIAVTGVWLARDTSREGEAQLRARMTASLEATALAVGDEWVNVRAQLLQVAEGEAARRLVAGPVPATTGRPPWPATPRDSQALQAMSSVTELRDAVGTVRAVFSPADEQLQATRTAASLPVTFTIRESGSAALLGAMSTHLPLAQVLPDEAWLPSVAGAVVVVFDSAGGDALTRSPMPANLLEGARTSWNEETWLVERRRLSEPPLTLVIAAPVSAFTQPFARAARRGAMAMSAVLLVALLTAVWATRRVVEPLARVAAASAAVAGGQLDQSVPEQGPEEIRGLARAFNAMTGSLRDLLRQRAQRESVAAVGEFAASLAHEVRNPLTSLRFDLEHAREQLHDPGRAESLIVRAVQDVERLDRVVSGALSIARSGTLTIAPVDIVSPVRGAAHAARRAFLERGALLNLDLPTEPCVVPGNEAALHQLMLNLLLNAAEASSAGQTTTVRLHADRRAVVVTVSDEGAGMDAETLRRVSEPFFTTKEGGTGLGLAIAHRIAAAHGGGLRMDSEPGAGTTVTLTVPRASRGLGGPAD